MPDGYPSESTRAPVSQRSRMSSPRERSSCRRFYFNGVHIVTPKYWQHVGNTLDYVRLLLSSLGDDEKTARIRKTKEGKPFDMSRDTKRLIRIDGRYVVAEIITRVLAVRFEFSEEGWFRVQ